MGHERLNHCGDDIPSPVSLKPLLLKLRFIQKEDYIRKIIFFLVSLFQLCSIKIKITPRYSEDQK